MFFLLYAEEHGLKSSLVIWVTRFRRSAQFRKTFVLIFYTMMILFRTLLNRNMWMNPVSDVIGVWGLYNDKGELTTEVLENLALFIPFTVLLLWNFQEKLIDRQVRFFKMIWKCMEIVFLFSLTIETLQLLFRLGTFQLSDLFYNTLGGFIGGLIYWVGYKMVHRKKKKEQ